MTAGTSDVRKADRLRVTRRLGRLGRLRDLATRHHAEVGGKDAPTRETKDCTREASKRARAYLRKEQMTNKKSKMGRRNERLLGQVTEGTFCLPREMAASYVMALEATRNGVHHVPHCERRGMFNIDRLLTSRPIKEHGAPSSASRSITYRSTTRLPS